MTAADTVSLAAGFVHRYALTEAPGLWLAERIMANRPYQKVDDLLKVRGIGTNNLERFRDRVRTE